jgi:TetR/AcrR family tetracycline transcriptional repressor
VSGQNGSVPAAPDDAPDRRRRPAGLSEAQIIEAALRVIRKDGVDGLSMRRLSKELGVTPMAPYYYVSDKQALLDLVVSAALAGIDVPPAGVGPWHVRLRLVVDQIDRQVRSHPGIGDVLLERMLSTQRGLLTAIVDLLAEAGFAGPDILMAYATVHTYLFGRYRAVLLTPDASPLTDPDDSLSRLSEYMDDLHGRDFYDFGVDTIIRGLRARLGEPPGH